MKNFLWAQSNDKNNCYFISLLVTKKAILVRGRGER